MSERTTTTGSKEGTASTAAPSFVRALWARADADFVVGTARIFVTERLNGLVPTDRPYVAVYVDSNGALRHYFLDNEELSAWILQAEIDALDGRAE